MVYIYIYSYAWYIILYCVYGIYIVMYDILFCIVMSIPYIFTYCLHGTYYYIIFIWYILSYFPHSFGTFLIIKFYTFFMTTINKIIFITKINNWYQNFYQYFTFRLDYNINKQKTTPLWLFHLNSNTEQMNLISTVIQYHDDFQKLSSKFYNNDIK